MTSHMQHDKRLKIRVDFQTQITIDFDRPAIQLTGDSRNLSVNGIYVSTTENVPINTKCHVRVFLTGTVPPVPLTMEGTVVRKETAGLAIRFDSMDIDSYTELKNIVRYNTENPDDVY